MKYQKENLKRLKWLLMPVFIISFFGFVNFASADDLDLDFEDYSVGSICSETNWSCIDEITDNVTISQYLSPVKSLEVETTAVLSDYVGYSFSQVSASQYDFSWWIKFDANAGNTACVSFANDASVLHTYICAENDGSLYINGSDSGRNIDDDVWSKVYLEIDETEDEARVKVDIGTWSTWKNTTGSATNTSEMIQISATGDSIFIDNIVSSVIDPLDVSWDYSGTLREDIPDFTTNINTVCFVGQDCNIWVNYNEMMDGQEIRLIDNSDTLLDADTVSWVAPPEVALIYPYSAQTAGEIEVFNLMSPVCYNECLFDTCVEGCGIVKGGFVIEWWDEEDYLPDFSFITNDPCWNIATSTGTFADDFRYGMECGAMRVFTWAFEPNATTTNKLANSIDDFWQNFPFSTLTNVKTLIENNSGTTTTQLMPVLSATGTIMGYVFDAEKLQSDPNYYIVDDIKTWLNYAIIFFFGVYLIMRIISVINGAKEELEYKKI